MTSLALALALAISRAEIVERFKAPAVTQADGLVKVYANCPEDMRREFQAPVARFAAETAAALYGALAIKPVHCDRPGIVLRLGDVRTNVAEVVARAVTNEGAVVTYISLPAPGFADLYRLKLELAKAFYRRIKGEELSDEQAIRVCRQADPRLRVEDARAELEDWLAGRGQIDDEDGIRLLRKVFEPGVASPRDVLIFASHLYFYPPQRDVRLLGRFESLSFREALKFGRIDKLLRALAYVKAREVTILGGGRGAELTAAAEAYRVFLLAFARAADAEALADLLEDAEVKLNVAFEKAMTR